MRIRPVFVTVTSAVISCAAIAVVVLTASPQETGSRIIVLLWLAIFLGAWSVVSTLLLMLRQSMAQAILVGIWPALSVVWLLLLLQRGLMSQRLLIAVILTTGVLSFVIWWKIRRAQRQYEHH